MRTLVIVTTALTLVASAAAAQTSVPPVLPANPTPGVAAPPAETKALAEINDDTTVCVYERMTGTLLMERVCRTQRAWKLMREDAHEYMEFGFRGGSQGNEGGGSARPVGSD
jgi:hypothetical protein